MHSPGSDAVQAEKLIEVRGQIRKRAVAGVEQRAGGRPAETDTVEDGAAVR